MINLRIIKSYRDVVTACDSEILGKHFEQGKFQLDLKESFYKGEKVSEQKAVELMKKMSAEDATFNIAGADSIAAALKAGIITKESIGHVQGIPFTLILL